MTSTLALIERLKDPWRHTEELCFEAAAALTTLEAERIVAPAECSNCDDPDCPYSHKPLTLREAYENSLTRLRSAATELTTLLERCEKAEARVAELEDFEHLANRLQDALQEAEEALKIARWNALENERETIETTRQRDEAEAALAEALVGVETMSAWRTHFAEQLYAAEAHRDEALKALSDVISGYEEYEMVDGKPVLLPDEKQSSWIRRARAARNAMGEPE